MKRIKIEVDADVYEALKRLAIPFEDHEPGDVVRRLAAEHTSPLPLEIEQANPEGKDTKAGQKAIPQHEYIPVIIDVLNELGGEAHVDQIRPLIEKRMSHRFTPADLRDHKPSVPKWWNNAQWGRLRMRDDGLLEANTPHGTWKLTAAAKHGSIKTLMSPSQ